MVYRVVDDYPEEEFDAVDEPSKRGKKKSFINRVLPWKRRVEKDEAKVAEGMLGSILTGCIMLLNFYKKNEKTSSGSLCSKSNRCH